MEMCACWREQSTDEIEDKECLCRKVLHEWVRMGEGWKRKRERARARGLGGENNERFDWP